MANKKKTGADEKFAIEMADIENELVYYRSQLKGKAIFLNCCDTENSSFWKWFSIRFASLELKKLSMVVHNTGKLDDLMEMTAPEQTTLTPIVAADFTSPAVKEVMRQSDIVVSELPTSRFWDCLSLMMELEKEFFLLGKISQAGGDNTFSLMQQGKVWLGYTSNGFLRWYTNLDVATRHQHLPLYRKYKEADYPAYDNCDAINVDKTNDIPRDYGGVMGVPISFLDHYCPSQFEIVGLGRGGDFKPTTVYHDARRVGKDGKTSKTNAPNKMVMLLENARPDGETYYTANNVNGFLVATYVRILIRNKTPRK